jgi:hypothetical protein
MATEENVIHTNVSPSMHPDSTAVWGVPQRDAKNNLIPAPLVADGKDLPALTAGKAALTALYHGLNQCEEAVNAAKSQYGVSPNAGKVTGQPMPPVLPEERANELAASLGVRYSAVAKTVDQQVGIISDHIASLDQQIKLSLINPKKDVLSATEASDVRRLVRDMPTPGERMNWMHSRLEEGDHAVVSAVLASHWASGIDKANYETLTDLASRKFAPVQRAQIDACRALHSHVLHGAQRWVDRYRVIAPVARADSPAVAAAKKLRE